VVRDLESQRGIIAKIEPFAIHHGPGIRTAIFLKGCPLKCLWCSSPHLQKRIPEILHDTGKCRKCRTCVKLCPQNAIAYDDLNTIRIDQAKCDECGLCVENCPHGALILTGKYYSVEGLLTEVEKDASLYRRSDGGVTVSGGEPAMQPGFISAFLNRCKQEHLHTAMETSGYASWRIMKSLIASLDLVYFDIKHMNDQTHRQLTGVSNQVILENIKRTVEHRPVILRIPTVPGLNDAFDNIVDTATFARSLGDHVIRIELLPFHKLAEGMYRRLDAEYSFGDLQPFDEETIGRIRDQIAYYGLNVQIGG
jgi:pyruvate formate lyase activating enzyme